MQILIQLHNSSPFSIPLNYNYQVQSSIYRKLSEVGQADFWHDVGFGDLSRFKTFVFGRLNGDSTVFGKTISFHGDIELEVRSPAFSFCDAIQRSIEKKPQIRLFDRQLPVSQCTLANRHLWTDRLLVQTLSPIVIKQKSNDGKSMYCSPEDAEYSDRINKNFMKKYQAVYGTAPKGICVSPVREIKKTVTSYKKTWITAYDGVFLLEGSIPCLEFLYNCGLGEKNAQGFGMFSLANH